MFSCKVTFMKMSICSSWTIFHPQREKEDALIELETHKEKLEKEKMNVKIISEEKDMNNKEFERLLEKFDR